MKQLSWRNADMRSRFAGILPLAALLWALALAAGCSSSTSTDAGTTAEKDTEPGEDGSISADGADGKADAEPGDAADTSGGACTSDDQCTDKVNVDPAKCIKAVCNAGKCGTGPADKGSSCDDGQKCTTKDQCNGVDKGLSACTGTVECAAPAGKDAACVVAKCADDGSGECQYSNAVPGTPCDDKNSCTVQDKCVAGGKCAAGSPKTCPDDGNPCTQETCDEKTAGGDCSSAKVPAGDPCNDGNPCTSTDTCDAGGTCVGVAVTCVDDGNPCTAEYCDSVKGCSKKAQNDGSPCDDNDACTSADMCASQFCVGKAVSGIDDGNPCTKDLGSGIGVSKCSISHEPTDGNPCDDGAPCTKSDTCKSGACKGSDLVCNDGNPCTNDQCDPTKCADSKDPLTCGQCVSPAVKEGTACDDGNKCTSKDLCTASPTGAKCIGIDLLATGGCDDKNPCTNDGCQPGVGCINVPNAAAACSDNDPCTISDACVGATCKGVARDCKDLDKCTADTCDSTVTDPAKACIHSSFDGPCDDGNACSTGDVCTAGVCAGPKAVKCDDGNPCTIDTCNSAAGSSDPKLACTFKNAPGGAACDDGLSCTVNDYCDLGKCVAAQDNCKPCTSDLSCAPYDDGNYCNGIVKCIDNPAKGKVCAVDVKTVIKCDASSDTPCSTNTCNPNTGGCSPSILAEGSPCKASDKCLTATTCAVNGQCQGKQVNCDDKNDCTTEVCDSALGCKFTPKADNTACDDGSLCTPTESDKCSSGQCLNPTNSCACTKTSDCDKYANADSDQCNEKWDCVVASSGKVCKPIAGSVTVCETANDTPCTVSTCEPLTGKCAAQTKSDSTLCDDGNVCTVGDFCKSGLCTKTKDLNCDDGNACTVDVCDVFGCDHGPKTGAGGCDDGDKCTSGDKCVDGVCAGVKITCDDQNPCTVDTCSKSGGCANQVDNTLKCDDGDPCSTGDICTNGQCAGKALNCDDKNSCTIDVCDGKGGCNNLVIDGKDCDDGNACTVQDTCKSNQCVGVTKSCDDLNPCTEDSCKNGTCGYLVSIGKTCDDGNACTKTDACDKAGACTGVSYTCDTTNTCIAYPQGCLATKGCLGVSNDGIPCNDGDACTAWSGADPTPDHCLGGACTGLPVTCDDKNVCTNDVCDKKKGCLITQNTCDDGNPCTTDTCDQILGCQHAVLDGAACDDGDACTDQTKCDAGKCKGTAVTCDDENGCTSDSCDSKSGCVFLPGVDTQTTCDDLNPCTEDACKSGVCVGTSKQCDDGNPCTQDSCDKLKGCVTVDLKENTVCDDGDACTDNTKCLSGQCAGGTVSNSCGACKVDADCNIFDNNNKCDGAYSCKQSAVSGVKLCYFDPTPVFCDSLGDTDCTKNTCQTSSGLCAMTAALNGTKCEDGLGCTAADICMNGTCKAGGLTDCSKSPELIAAGAACNDATCNETGKAGAYTCVILPKAGTPTCDADGSGCTFNDSCLAGKCVAGAAVDCSGVAGECQVASCKSTGASAFQCVTAAAKDGDGCNDKQLCTDGDFCKAGKCQAGTGVHDCSSLASTCADGTCDKAGNGGLGACIPKAKNDGAACDADSNGCTQGDKCVAGSCVPGISPDCTGKTIDCGVGACSSSGAGTYTCMSVPKKDGLPCDADGTGCTVGDSCKVGKCAAGAQMDCKAKDSADGCQVGVCKSPSGLAAFCDIGFALAEKACNGDSNGCTQGDTCNGQGACEPGKAVDCLGVTTGCTQGSCKSTGAATYSCQGDPKPDGSKCDADQSGCTLGDTCKTGKCAAGSAVDCAKELNVKATACTSPTCISSGSETHQCDNASNKDGTTCDADGKYCTPGDSCQLGFCTAGDLQTCSTVASLCADAACQELPLLQNFKCVATPKESYPVLDPPLSCTPTDTPPKCATGYTCTVLNKVTNLAQCMPKVTINCDDGDKCTEGDACAAGKCLGGLGKDCDDKDACTLDSCNAGTCANQAIPGCTACLDEKFDTPVPLSWASTHTDTSGGVPYVLWKSSDKKPYAGPSNQRAEWKGAGPTGAPSVLSSNLTSRRFYTQDSAAATLEFYLSMDVALQDCGFDDLQVLVNKIKVYERCDTVKSPEFEVGSTYTKVTIDLTKYAGAPMDIEFVAVAGTTADNKGTIDIDSIKLTGACGPGCLGASFEPRTNNQDVAAVDLVAAAIPQPFRMTSTDSGYAGFAAAASNGHTGLGFLTVTYAGKPTSGKSETAKLTIPKVQAGTADKLWFALRAPKVADETCGADDFVVKVGGKEVFKRCNALANWQTFSIDLPAGATSDVEFSVVTGAASTTAGTFEIDDIGVAGSCMYACWYDNFDQGGFATNWATQASNGWKPWVLSTALAKTPTGSLFGGYTSTAIPKALSFNNIGSKIAAQGSVLGGVWSYYLNLSVDTANCPAGVVEAFRYSVVGKEPASVAALSANLDGNFTLDAACQSTTGWAQRIGELPPASFGLDGKPVFIATAYDKSKTLSIYADEVLLMCR